MAGAWELKAANQMLLGILHTEGTSIHWSFSFRQLIVPGSIYPIAGAPFDHARNLCCQKALEMGVEWCCFLDSDIALPPDSFLRLIAHRRPVMSGVYFRRSPPHGFPVAQKSYNGHRTWLQEVPKAGLIEVEVVGAGMLAIHRSVLETMVKNPIHPAKKWFFWGVDQQGYVPPEYGQSEDFSFCSHVRKLGIPVLVDCGVRGRHLGLAEYGHGTVKPAEVVPT